MIYKKSKNIYLDYAASTPLDQSIAKNMTDHERKLYANASAIHSSGVRDSIAIENARSIIANAIFAHSDEIIFTGSGTESDALAILGSVHAYRNLHKQLKKAHVVTSSIEHPAVLENCKMLEENGEADVTYVSIDEFGIVNTKEIKDAIQENTVIVSIMYANNEIGTVQPIMDIAKIIRHFRKNNNSKLPLFHSDACQAINYLPIENIEKLGVDLLAFNSSKIYGPKGVGVLYKKRGINFAPLYRGGGQEQGLRSGTENTSAILGLSEALIKASKIKDKEVVRLTHIRDYGIDRLLSLSEVSGYKIILNGDKVKRLPNNINISISGISSELLVIELDAKGIQVSAKSACKSDEPDESYVITALRIAQGINSNGVEGSLRISLGRATKKSDMDILATILGNILDKYKKWK